MHPTLSSTNNQAESFEAYGAAKLETIPQLRRLPPDVLQEMRVVATVLPFRVNRHVVENLIDWDNVPADPLFQLTFPQRDMLAPEDYERVAALVERGDKQLLAPVVESIRANLNPHPGGQQALNVPHLDGVPVDGLQHKYPETVLIFPSQGQTCHSYCTFCFRWAQFVQDKELRFATSGLGPTFEYLKRHREVTDVLITGGDPMVMKVRRLEEYLLPLLEPEFEHIQTIRIGSKSLSFWPQRFVTDADADELLGLFERLVAGGKHVAFMAHYNHWRELLPRVAHDAIRRIRNTGAMIRSQGPVLAHINDTPDAWSRLWTEQVRLGISPYYMFVERDTGARRYFEIPLAQALEVYQGAVKNVSGLARTARGPVMSAGPGKVKVEGTATINGEKVFVLNFVQARREEWVGRPFFAKYDREATWLHKLRPFGAERFFFEEEYSSMQAEATDETGTKHAASQPLAG